MSLKSVESSWQVERLAMFSASGIHKLFTEPKLKEDKAAGNLSEGAKTYCIEKLAESLTGLVQNLDNVSAIAWGNMYEPEAITHLLKLYPSLIYYGKENQKFFTLDDFSGGSPDFVIEESFTVGEIKCPENPTNHIKYMMLKNGNDLKDEKKEYWYQLQMNMMCVAKEMKKPFSQMKGLFVSYFPIMFDEKYKLHIVEVLPDEDFEKNILLVIEKATKYLKQLYKQLE